MNVAKAAFGLMGIFVACAAVACAGTTSDTEETGSAKEAILYSPTPIGTVTGPDYSLNLQLCLNLCQSEKNDDDAYCYKYYGPQGLHPSTLALSNCLAQSRNTRNQCDNNCETQFGSTGSSSSSSSSSSSGIIIGGGGSGSSSSSSSGGPSCISCLGRSCGSDPCGIALSCGDCPVGDYTCNQFGSCEHTSGTVNGGCTANYQCASDEACNLATGECCGGTHGCHMPVQE